MKFEVIGNKEVDISFELVGEIVTTELNNVIFWNFNGMVNRRQVRDFMDNRNNLSSVDLNQLGYYVLFYAENLVFSTYLITKANEGEDYAKDYLEYQNSLLEELRVLYKELIDSVSHKIVWLDVMVSSIS